MIKMPLIVLSYGQFEISRKLFSFEKYGVNMMPVFTDGLLATKFCSQMTELLRAEFKDRRKLQTQICTDIRKAFDMFVMISVQAQDLHMIVVDPSPPNAAMNDFRLIEETYEIDEFIGKLQDLLNSSADSKTK